jgi:hypothetical protein
MLLFVRYDGLSPGYCPDVLVLTENRRPFALGCLLVRASVRRDEPRLELFILLANSKGCMRAGQPDMQDFELLAAKHTSCSEGTILAEVYRRAVSIRCSSFMTPSENHCCILGPCNVGNDRRAVSTWLTNSVPDEVWHMVLHPPLRLCVERLARAT